jgi:O-antigen/teichoic acid export membrane protein
MSLKIQNSKFKIYKYIKHPLFSGSAVMIVGSNSANFIAYIYHLIIGRLLGPSSYGELASILSLMALLFTSFNFFTLVIVKFVSSAEDKDLPSIYKWFNQKLLLIGGVIAFVILVLTPALSGFLRVNIKIVVLLVPIFVVGVVGLLYRAFLQGLLKFKELVISTNAEILARLIFGVVLILVGFSVFGAVVGLLIGATAAVVILWVFLKGVRTLTVKEGFKGGAHVFRYSIPILLSSVATTSFFTSDVVLAKHFLSAHGAGIYASLSTLGKIVFYGTAPISAVMFPMVSKRHAKGQAYHKIFWLSFFLTLLISLVVVFIYWMLPTLSINILYGSQFLEGSIYLVWFGVFMTIYTLSSLLINYYLSREKVKIVIPLIFFALFQIVGIILFHKDILNIIRVSTTAVTLLLISLFIYFVYERRVKEI